MRVFSSRTLASQRERQRQSELRKRDAELKRGRRGQRGGGEEVEEGRVKLRGGDKQEARGIKAQKDHGRNDSKNVQEWGANFSSLTDRRGKSLRFFA